MDSFGTFKYAVTETYLGRPCRRSTNTQRRRGEKALACAEGDYAADRIVRRNPHRHAITRYDLDAEAAHTAAQLGEHFLAGIALHTIETAAVHCHDCSLNVYQIVFAQSILPINFATETGRKQSPGQVKAGKQVGW
jgi:hypothetical protein